MSFPESTWSSGASAGGTWRSERSISIPQVDIVTYAFGRTGEYPQDRAIFIDAVDESRYVSAEQARRVLRQLIAGLKAKGFEEGDCVCLHSYNNTGKTADLGFWQILYPLVWLAGIGAGGSVSGTNPSHTPHELVHHLNKINAKFIISQFDCLANVEEAARKCQIPKSRVFVLGLSASRLPVCCQSWEILLGYGECDWRSLSSIREVDSTIAAIGSTSGTTGMPKAAAISHGCLVAQSSMIEFLRENRMDKTTQLVFLPVFHAFASQLSLVLPLRTGTPTYFMRKFNLKDFVDVIKKYSITDTAVVPTIIPTLLKADPEVLKGIGSLQYVLCAGAPMDPHLQQKLYPYMSSSAVIGQVWGTTETGWATAFGPTDKDATGSVGRLLPNVELRILDQNGQLLGEGKYGEACIRTPSLYSSYLGSTAISMEELDADGFYRTGDRAYFQDGKLFIDGRIKDIMKVNGWQVAPAELEGILLQHPDVFDCAVTGSTVINEDGLAETRPCACVVLLEGPPKGVLNIDAFEREVQTFVASKVASYKRLTGGVVIVEKIPRSNTGKILRRELLNEKKIDLCPARLTEEPRKSLSI